MVSLQLSSTLGPGHTHTHTDKHKHTHSCVWHRYTSAALLKNFLKILIPDIMPLITTYRSNRIPLWRLVFFFLLPWDPSHFFVLGKPYLIHTVTSIHTWTLPSPTTEPCSRAPQWWPWGRGKCCSLTFPTQISPASSGGSKSFSHKLVSATFCPPLAATRWPASGSGGYKDTFPHLK